MSAHIPPHRLLPQDMVDIHDHGPAAGEKGHAEWRAANKAPVKMRMHAVDAKQAMATEPARWKLDADDALSRPLPAREPERYALEPLNLDDGAINAKSPATSKADVDRVAAQAERDRNAKAMSTQES